MIEHLPRVADYWEDPFYRDHFAPAEIAYCQLQETPALHFAARWCAKEALRKCDGAFLSTAMKDIEVVADETGAPFLVYHAGGGTRRLPHAVSLSHTRTPRLRWSSGSTHSRRFHPRETLPLSRRCPPLLPPRHRGSLYRSCWASSPWCGDRGAGADVLDRAMTLLIVIVNYRTTELTLDCLRSLQDEVGTVAGTRVVVTDNASGDDSVAHLEAAVSASGWGGWATIQALEQNGGFAAGNNAAIRPALVAADPPRYVLLLNPDTIVRPGAVRALVKFMEDRPDVGIAGSRLEEPDGTPQRSAFRFPSVLGELEGGLRLGPASRLLARWVSRPGGSRGARPDRLGCRGVHDHPQRGFRVGGPDGRRLFHVFRRGGLLPSSPPRRLALLVRSRGTRGAPGRAKLRGDQPQRSSAAQAELLVPARRRYFLNNHGRLATVLADLAWSLGHASYRLRRLVQRKPDTDPQWLLWDFIRFNFLLAQR